MKNSSNQYYGSVAQAFHWITAILVLIAFTLGPGGSEQQIYSSENAFDRELHETLGVCIFMLTILRLLWRIGDKRPQPPNVPRWMDIGASTLKWGLYVLLFALPITAISGAWLEGHSLSFVGNLQVRPLIVERHDLGEIVAEIHSLLGDVILWLAGIHSAAALFHHFILKDNVLRSMLPSWLPLRRK
jgi:cytochrome b561